MNHNLSIPNRNSCNMAHRLFGLRTHVLGPVSSLKETLNKGIRGHPAKHFCRQNLHVEFSSQVDSASRVHDSKIFVLWSSMNSKGVMHSIRGFLVLIRNRHDSLLSNKVTAFPSWGIVCWEAKVCFDTVLQNRGMDMSANVVVVVMIIITDETIDFLFRQHQVMLGSFPMMKVMMERTQSLLESMQLVFGQVHLGQVQRSLSRDLRNNHLSDMVHHMVSKMVGGHTEHGKDNHNRKSKDQQELEK
mmetsp:Transcript_21379/g.31821  ORF Transcript_21379/g.31821 Transcript_21379/m.31821 type:complete len:245 (-) Transcript_21379:240-974(-)